jgi:hypothetical protein
LDKLQWAFTIPYYRKDIKRFKHILVQELWPDEHPEFFIGGGGGADPEDIYYWCLILKMVLYSNATLIATAFVYIQT